MSFIFDPPVCIETSFILKPDENSGGPDEVLIGRVLWDDLSLNPTDNRACVSIKSLRNLPTDKCALTSIQCWGILDNDLDVARVAIPRMWMTQYNLFYSPDGTEIMSTKNTISVTLEQPAVLTEVVISALSSDAYKAASLNDSVLKAWFNDFQLILRQGDIHLFHGNASQLQYRLDMLEPVMQGYAQLGKTRIIISMAQATSLLEPFKMRSNDQEGFEIDEGFLAGSLMPQSFDIDPIESMFFDGVDSGERSSVQFKANHLLVPRSILHDHCTLYLRTADLGRLGVLNGDWVRAAVTTLAVFNKKQAIAGCCQASRYRLVRIVADDDVVDKCGIVKGSPDLLQNISYGLPESPENQDLVISIYSSLFGSRQPAIPTARTVTIARVASPLSNNRSYQHIFLAGLKLHFDITKRLIKQGDIIAVPLDTDVSRYSQDHDDDSIEFLNNLDPSYPATPSRSNEAVYFTVTNVEHDVMANGVVSSAQDIYVDSTMGELGCWVDPSVTRMVQAGVEHLRIPDLAMYLQLDSGKPKALFKHLQEQNAWHLLGPKSPFNKIISLTSAGLVPHAVDYNLNLSLLLKGARGTGKFTTISWVAQRLGIHVLELNCFDIIGENDAKTEGTLRAKFGQAGDCSPCILVLRHIEALSQSTQALDPSKEPGIANALHECIQEVKQTWRITGFPVIIIGTTSEVERVPMGILSAFKHEVLFEAPNEGERREILNCLLRNTRLASDVSLQLLAVQTAALVASDLVDLCDRAMVVSVERATCHYIASLDTHAFPVDIPLTAADFDTALGKARASYSESIGAPKIPNVSWDDVGGLAHVKSDILDTIQLPLDHPELFANGLKRRSGILLYGPPGTGKTLVAKAVATSCSLNFFSVKGPELLNMYIGESEANVRRVFQRARDAKPCVIFFDELDSVAPKRGNHGDSGGVMDRIVSQLLAELDGMSGGNAGADVFVIGATNRPDLLDQALLRPGRFDRMLYLGVSVTHEAQLSILDALTRKFHLNPDLDLAAVAEKCTFNYTGADFYALCSDAMLNAMSRKAEELEKKIALFNELPSPHVHPHPMTPQYYLAELALSTDIHISVSQMDFDKALQALVPSVSQEEMEHYDLVQQRFSGPEPLDEE